MADATYQPKVYRDSGGDRLNVISGGSLNIESGSSVALAGTVNVASGGSLTVDSGGNITISSGGAFLPASGSEFVIPYQVVSSSDTTLNNSGISYVTGTTVGPDYVLAAPTRAGLWKNIALAATSSGATHRATIYTGSTGRLVTYAAGSATGNTITLNTSAQHNITLVSAGTSGWVCISAEAVKEPALSNKST